jgi:hypothetical protein
MASSFFGLVALAVTAPVRASRSTAFIEELPTSKPSSAPSPVIDHLPVSAVPVRLGAVIPEPGTGGKGTRPGARMVFAAWTADAAPCPPTAGRREIFLDRAGRRGYDDGKRGGGMEPDRADEFRVKNEELLKKVKGIVDEGNARTIIIKDEKGSTYFEIPLTVGVVGALFLPVLVAVGALAALASNFTIEVVRRDEPAAGGPPEAPPPDTGKKTGA